ncbi:hypothetical protein FE374_02995 [Georgenia yuyongxinii]|uniref:Uncharacterized protein n=1 Tax=Georgenia yuyongxinii TaxID=2589797 RepID=A0A5B8C385_9MICO|nr:hypothetical protein [Georgenia yuyongxinii]QDC23735.1 hypothetical protein FE374_02995 [Georgenia yuyongxinii]
MHPAPRHLARAAAAVGAIAVLAGCASPKPSVLVVDEVPDVSVATDDAAAGAGVTSEAADSALSAAEPGSTKAALAEGVAVEDLGLLSTDQHDVAFGTVVNRTAATVRVTVGITTYDADGAVLSKDSTAEVQVPGRESTLFVADVFAPEGSTVATLDATHSVVATLAEKTSVPGAGHTKTPKAGLRLDGLTIHDDPLNPTITGRLASTLPQDLEAVQVSAVCTADGEPVAAGYGHVPTVAAGGTARYEILLFGSTPQECQVVATP